MNNIIAHHSEKIILLHCQVYEKTSGMPITADAVVAEFGVQYPDEDKDMVFGDSDDYDDFRKVSHVNLIGIV